jgi:hypothetical protein
MTNTPLVDGPGLYLDGRNVPPDSHIQKGIALAADMQRLDMYGNPDPNGKLVLFEGPGMSNIKRKSEALNQEIKAGLGRGRKYFTPFNACLWGWEFAKLQHDWPQYQAWLLGKMASYRVNISPLQVQAVWFSNSVRGQNGSFDKTVEDALNGYEFTYQKLRQLFPNLKQVFVSSSGCSYYAEKLLPRHEPNAGWEGYAARQFVANHMNDDIFVDWSWYGWADGPNPRRYDGLSWQRHHFERDGIHPTREGAAVWGRHLFTFFRNSPVTAGWFRGS